MQFKIVMGHVRHKCDYMYNDIYKLRINFTLDEALWIQTTYCS